MYGVVVINTHCLQEALHCITFRFPLHLESISSVLDMENFFPLNQEVLLTFVPNPSEPGEERRKSVRKGKERKGKGGDITKDI
jgi:hypothetical protein